MRGSPSSRQSGGRSPKGGAAYGRRNLLLYFEHDDLDWIFQAISPHVELIHPIERQAWGQRVFRFYDPDGHAIEIGEPQDPCAENGSLMTSDGH